MKRTKAKALAFWQNLHGYYEMIIFNTKKDALDFSKQYKKIYNEMLQEKITWQEFNEGATFLFFCWQPKTLTSIDEVYGKEIHPEAKNSKWLEYIITYINKEPYKVEVVERLDYGY